MIDERELARATDPSTSKDAVPTAEERQAFCDRLLEQFRRAELTAEEAADRAGLDRWQASKRVSDLKRLRLIRPTGEKRVGSSGKLQAVHRAVGVRRIKRR